ncbi:MAG: alpha/beta hydrolase [Taibaiella sp.]|nr:alpha/beta hydrolase [Taibaiella sp.]
MKNVTLSLIILAVYMSSSTALHAQQMTDSSITYIHSEKASFTSKLIQTMSSLFGVKKGGDIRKKLNQSASTEEPTPVPKFMCKKYDIQESTINNRKVWTIKPKVNASNKVILYLHGGVYVGTIKKYHWKFADDLILKTNATIVVPDYPLAPSSNCENAIDLVGQVYQELLKKHSPENIDFLGDSSGGGLALGFAMHLKKENKPQPNQIILLFPWLDVTMSNEDILEIDKKDKMLGIEPLQEAGKAFAGELDLKDYRVSPIYGDLSGLGKISVFVGTHDLLVADCRKLKSMADTSNTSMNYYEYPKMFHGWVLLTSMKEGKVALEQICTLINN